MPRVGGWEVVKGPLLPAELQARAGNICKLVQRMESTAWALGCNNTHQALGLSLARLCACGAPDPPGLLFCFCLLYLLLSRGLLDHGRAGWRRLAELVIPIDWI